MNKPLNFYTVDQVCEVLKVSTSTLARWRKAKEGPPHMIVGQVLRYPADGLRRWSEKQEVKDESP